MNRSFQSRINSRPRSGSTLLIVVALMGVMAFLGFVFYTFAAQEKANAVTLAESAKVKTAPSIEPDAIFDFVLQTIILGPNDNNIQSVLWGGRHSILANMFGRDGVPWNGEGVRLKALPNGQPIVDMDEDDMTTIAATGTAENFNLLNVADAPLFYPAVGGTATWTTSIWGPGKNVFTSGVFNPSTTQFVPQPDVDYNSPDINSLFLSYDGIAVNSSGVQTRVCIPSYFRPQYLRVGGVFDSTWFNDSQTISSLAGGTAQTNLQILRPHPNHFCVNPTTRAVLTSGGVNIPRYVSINDSPATNGFPTFQTLKLRRPFTSNSASPFAPPESTPGVNTPGSLGVWSNAAAPFDIDLDIDTDGDGIADSILMDLGYPSIRRGDGKLVVPLFAINIRDLNGLINLNATGNLNGNLNVNSVSSTNQLGFRPNNTPATGIIIPATGNFTADNLSKSNLGMSTSEINPQRALTADPTFNTVSGNYVDPQLATSEAAWQLSCLLSLFDPTVSTNGSPNFATGRPARSVAELANLEWLLLNIGRAQFHLGAVSAGAAIQNAITDLFPGRYSESVGSAPSGLRSFLNTFTANGVLNMPRAGQSVNVNTFTNPIVLPMPADDNNNFNEGETPTATPWAQPVDYRGAGKQYYRLGLGADGMPGKAGIDDDGNSLIDDPNEVGWPGSDDPQSFSTPVANSTMGYNYNGLYWPSYSAYHSYNGTIQWGSSTFSQHLMPSPVWFSLIDDPTETIVDPILLSPNYSGATVLTAGNFENSTIQNTRNNDAIFGPHENLFLQGSGVDENLTDSKSRLAELMPANLVASANASDIRKRFTTVSTDRREFGVTSRAVGQLRAEAGGAKQFLPWESTPVFPPDLTAPAAAPTVYRPELFFYLQQAAANASPSIKLNINRLLYTWNSAGPNYGFAPLPPQSTPGDNANDVAATTARQNMARDIYTLLFTLCQGQDNDYRTSPAPSAAQAQEMAQFAINVVDALDTDSIITAFFYDPDLTDGWTTAAAMANAPVFGVERQLLAISEVCAFRVKKATPDNAMTIFDDASTSADGRRYLYIELQNVTPLAVTLASANATRANVNVGTGAGGDWRISLYSVDSATNATVLLNRLVLLNGMKATTNNVPYSNGSNLQGIGGSAVTLAGGSLFTISSQDGTDTFMGGGYRTSDFRADQSQDGTKHFNRIVPGDSVPDTDAPAGVTKILPLSTTTAADFPFPKCNLDLVWDYGDGAASPSRFELLNNDGTPGGFVSGITAGIGAIQVVLERRVADGNLNPTTWTVVDKTPLSVNGAASPVRVGAITPPAAMPVAATDVTTALNGYTSFPRHNPVSFSSSTDTAGMIGSNSLNTASANNSSTSQWQPDRDFTSLAELLLVPLYGPDRLTDGRLGVSAFADETKLNLPFAGDPIYTNATNPKVFPVIGASRILRPDNPDQSGTSNRWYRLFQFLEVPNRNHQHPAAYGLPVTSTITGWGAPTQYGSQPTFTTLAQFATTTAWSTTASSAIPTSPVTASDNFPLPEPFNLPAFYGWPRVHGQINLNMIRYPQVLAALIDDDTLVNDPRFFNNTGAVNYIDPRYANQNATSNLDAADESTAGGVGTRQWWVQFLAARDSRMNSNGGGFAFSPDKVTQFYVPGTAAARPFRGFDSVGVAASSTGDSPLENTLFRSLPMDPIVTPTITNPNESRRLLEVGTPAEHQGKPTNESASAAAAPPTVLPPAVRYQLLSKLMNNTTTRSNSYGAFITVQYFEAVEVPTDTANVTAIRIGGHLTDTPTHRGFFVIDRTSAVEQMKILRNNVSNGTITIPAAWTSFPVSPSTFSFVPNTDTTGKRQLMNGIRWKDLVLYRQTLN